MKDFIQILLLSACFLSSCASNRQPEERNKKKLKKTDLSHLDFTMGEAAGWTALFDRSSGWFGGDGLFSIPLTRGNEGEPDSTLFVFSDTMIGEIVDGKLQSGAKMVHNSVAYMKGKVPEEGKIHFYYKKEENGTPGALFIPNTPHAQKGDYYWLGDGFVNKALDGNLYIFAYRMRNVSAGAWGFEQVGNAVIVLKRNSKPPFENQRQIETPFLIKGKEETENASLGAGILANTRRARVPHPDGYVYVYGVRGKAKELIVARVHPEHFEHFKKWRFWNGRKWQAGIAHAASVTDSVSNELSVTPLKDGRYALVFQVNGMSNKVGLRLGLTPYGPFGPVRILWTCREDRHKNYYTYNAKAHPGVSKEGRLLISYNVNAFDFFNELKKNPHLYRPRFIWLHVH